MNDPSPRIGRLSRKEWMLVALGLGAWLAIGAGGVWFVRQLTRPQASCGVQVEARGMQRQDASTGGPRNALQLLTGSGKCPS